VVIVKPAVQDASERGHQRGAVT